MTVRERPGAVAGTTGSVLNRMNLHLLLDDGSTVW
jgi:hypothetical protein